MRQALLPLIQQALCKSFRRGRGGGALPQLAQQQSNSNQQGEREDG